MATGGAHSQGALSAMIVGPQAAPHNYSTGTGIAVEFLSENIRKKGRHIGNNGIRGTLSEAKERVRNGASYFSGEIVMYISPNDIANFGVNVLGMTESPSGTFTVDDTLPYFGLLIDRDEGVVEFKNCMLDYWILQSRAPSFGEEGEPDMVLFRLGVIASEESTGTAWPGSPPALGTAAADAPYTFADTDGQISLAGSTRDVEEFIIVNRNFLKPKYTNSLLPTSIRPRWRLLQARFRVPWNSNNTNLYGLAVAGVAGSVTMVNAGLSTALTFGTLQVPDDSPVIPGKDQIDLIVDGVARTSGAIKELVIVNDNIA